MCGQRQRCMTLILLAAMGMLPGCSYVRNWHRNGFKVGPNYCTPAEQVAPDWIDGYDERVRQELPDYHQWWLAFQDPILSGLIEDTYRQNLSLRVAGMRVLEARALRGIAAGLIFPQFQEAFGNYLRSEVSINQFPLSNIAAAGVVFPNVFENWSTGFNAAWELDIWGRYRRGIESASANLDASIEDYDAILLSLIAETANAYMDYRVAQQRLEYAQQNVDIQEGSLEIAEVKFRNGGVTELDVTQAKTNLQQTRQLIPLLKIQLRLANNRLCVLTGLPTVDLATRLGKQPIPFTPADVVVGVPANLLRRRPDVRAAERRVATQSAQIGVAVADLLPSFSIVGSIKVDAEEFSNLFRGNSSNSFIAPGFNWDILNYGRIRNNVRVQEARFQQLAISYQQTVLQANAEIENGIVRFLQNQQRVIELQGAVEASERSVELGLTQYRDGAIDFNRVFNLQTALTSQQDQLVAARGDLSKSLVDIYKALGGGWQIRLRGSTASGIACDTVPGGVQPASQLETLPAPDNGNAMYLNSNPYAYRTDNAWGPYATLSGPMTGNAAYQTNSNQFAYRNDNPWATPTAIPRPATGNAATYQNSNRMVYRNDNLWGPQPRPATGYPGR